MGYNASKKSQKIVDSLEYILAIELLSVIQAHQFMEKELNPGSVSRIVLDEIVKTVPVMDVDMYIYPHINTIKNLIHSEKILKLVEEKVGKLE